MFERVLECLGGLHEGNQKIIDMCVPESLRSTGSRQTVEPFRTLSCCARTMHAPHLACIYFGKIPCLALGTSLLSFSLFVGPILEFHSAGTSLMSRFDLYFSKRWSFLVPDTRVTWRRLCESNSLNCVQNFVHQVSPKLFCSLRSECIRVLWYTTPLWYAIRNSHSAFVFTFSSFWAVVFLWLFFFGCSSIL